MNEEEIAAIVAAKIAEVEARHQTEIEALKSKNDQLLNEKKAVKAAAEAAERERAEKKGDIDAIRTLHQNELIRLQSQIEERDNKIKTYLIDNNIANVLAKSNVHESAIDVLTTYFKSKATIVDDRAVIDNLPLNAAISDYLGNEANRMFVRAPQNGGLTTSGSTTGSGHEWTRAPQTADEMDKWFSLQNDNPNLANSLAEIWGRSDLKS